MTLPAQAPYRIAYVTFPSSELLSLSEYDAFCIDVDELWAQGKLAIALGWIKKAKPAHKEVLAVGKAETLLGIEAIMLSEVTFIEKSGTLASLKGPELASAISVELNEICAPFVRTSVGFCTRAEGNMANDDFPEEIKTQVDQEYSSFLLSNKQRHDLLASVNGLDEQSDEDDERAAVRTQASHVGGSQRVDAATLTTRKQEEVTELQSINEALSHHLPVELH